MAGALRPTVQPPREPAAPPSLAVLFRRHARFAARMVVRLGGHQQAELVLADIFVRAGRRRHRLSQQPSAAAWFLQLTSACVARAERRARLRRLVTRTPLSLWTSLPSRERTALLLTELDQLPAADVAALMSTTVVDVERRLARGRERLGAALPAVMADLAQLPAMDDLALARVRARVLRTREPQRAWPRALIPLATFALLATVGALALAWNPSPPVARSAAATIPQKAAICGEAVCR